MQSTQKNLSENHSTFFVNIFKTVLLISLFTALLLGIILTIIVNKNIKSSVIFNSNSINTQTNIADYSIPENEAEKLYEQYLQQNFVINLVQAFLISFLIVLPINVLLVFTLSKRLISPINKLNLRLKENLAKVGQNNLYKMIKLQGPTEIRDLLKAYNELIRKLNKLEAARQYLVQDINHELKTPITKLQLGIEAIIDNINKPTKTNLNALLQDVAQLKFLINRLQELINIVNIPLKKEKINVYKFVDTILKGFNATLHNTGVKLENKVDKKLFVYADKNRFYQLINNLITNAIKHTHKGKISIYNKDSVLIIKDTGKGISKKDLPFVFERFYKAKNSRNAKDTGLGLGLSIVKEIIDLHNWDIKIQSQLNKGTKVLIYTKQH